MFWFKFCYVCRHKLECLTKGEPLGYEGPSGETVKEFLDKEYNDFCYHFVHIDTQRLR
jgi:hypothetical protein